MLNPMSLLHLTKRYYLVATGSLLLATVVALAASIGLNRPDPVTLPDQTAIHVTLDQAVTSDQNRPGDHFEATVSQPIVVTGKTVIPAGAPVEGLVVDAQHSGRLMGRARLQLAVESVTVNGKSYEVRTVARTRIGRNHNKRNIALIGGGAGGGAIIGAVAAGGKGALIGGPIGAGVGTAAAFITGAERHPPAS